MFSRGEGLSENTWVSPRENVWVRWYLSHGSIFAERVDITGENAELRSFVVNNNEKALELEESEYIDTRGAKRVLMDAVENATEEEKKNFLIKYGIITE